MTIKDWLEGLAGKEPAPGGGAVGALSAAIAAAQLSMVAVYTTGPKWHDREGRMTEISNELTRLRTRALALIESDATAFAKVAEAYKLPKSTDQERIDRNTAIQQTLTAATEPPEQTATLAARLLSIAEELVAVCNPNVISDVGVGASMARAAVESAIYNLEINEQVINDPAVKEHLQQVVVRALASIQAAASINESVRKKIQES